MNAMKTRTRRQNHKQRAGERKRKLPGCRLLPSPTASLTHFVRTIFTSVSSPTPLKNSFSLSSVVYLGRLFTQMRDMV